MNNIEKDYININLEKFNNNKRTHFIFGKNGTGKTTFSREVKKSGVKSFVYNKDFIFENIYEEVLISGELESNQAPENKRKSFSIFFGQEAQKILLEKQKYLSEKQEIVKDFNQKTKIDDKFLRILEIANIKISTDIKVANFKTVKEKNYLKNAKNISKDNVSKLELLVEKIQSLKVRNLLITKWNDINKEVNSLNSSIKKYNEVLDLDSTDSITYDVHKKATKYDKDVFIWMGAEYPKADIISYLKELSNTKIKIMKETLDKANSLILNIETIENDTQYLKVFQANFVSEINELKILIKNEKSNIDKEKIANEVTLLNEIEIEKYEKLSDEISLILGDNRYCWLNNLSEAKKLFTQIEQKDNLIDNLTQELKEKQSEIEEKSENDLNKHLNILSAGKIQVKLETKSSKTNSFTEISLLNDMDIGKLSDGEKNSLALAYFLVYLEKELEYVNEDFLVVIDDPFDSNDHYRIDSFRDIVFNFFDEPVNLSKLIWKWAERNKVSSKYIFMTHDIATLSSMSVGFIDIKECKKQFHFMPISNIFYKNLEVYNLSNIEDKKSKLELINLSHFFPNEIKISETFLDIFKTIWKSGITAENLWAIKASSIFLCKYYDKTDNNYRLFFKDIALDVLANKEIPSLADLNKSIPVDEVKEINELSKKSYNILKNNEFNIINFDEDELESFVKDTIDKRELKYYIKFFIQHINSVIDEKNVIIKDKKMKRLRHKNNYQYSLISYAVED